MSRAWRNGSDPRWRKLRVLILERDGWICQLCGQRIQPGLHQLHPRSAQVHHTRPRAIVGDDPRYLRAAHRDCNAAAGEPTSKDPSPTVRAWWSA